MKNELVQQIAKEYGNLIKQENSIISDEDGVAIIRACRKAHNGSREGDDEVISIIASQDTVMKALDAINIVSSTMLMLGEGLLKSKR